MGIGGYFELELRPGTDYHSSALKLNSGRNAFQYILITKNYRSIYLPYFTCSSIIEAAQKLGVRIRFYYIDEYFIPIFNFKSIDKDEAFLFINYFGICDHIVSSLAEKCPNLIIDNSQAFFAKPVPEIDTFYSARKFFGVPDGAYLYLNNVSAERLLDLHVGKSVSRFGHLITRIEQGPEAGYKLFKKNNNILAQETIQHMSVLTDKMLHGIDYQHVIERRRANFGILHNSLREINDLSLTLATDSVPMVYPLLCINPALKSKLLKNKVYVPTYWPNILKDNESNCLEYKFADQILHLPIDQRYGEVEMKKILQIIV